MMPDYGSRWSIAERAVSLDRRHSCDPVNRDFVAKGDPPEDKPPEGSVNIVA